MCHGLDDKMMNDPIFVVTGLFSDIPSALMFHNLSYDQGCRTGPHVTVVWSIHLTYHTCGEFFFCPFLSLFRPFPWHSFPRPNYLILSRQHTENSRNASSNLAKTPGTPSPTLMKLQYEEFRIVWKTDPMGHWGDGWRTFVRRRGRGPSLCLWIQKWLWLYFWVIWRYTEGIRFF